MAKPQVGIQLIIFGQRQREDLPGVLRAVAEAGYAGVEAGNLARQMPVGDARGLLEENGLALCGVHAGFEEFQDAAKLEENIRFTREMGARYLMCSGVGDRKAGMAAYETAAEVFNKAGRTCRKAGVALCYHNHNWEFESFDGVKGIHRLADLTDPAAVKLCIDVYWVQVGGEDPVAFIQRYRDRAAYFHFKDGRPGEFLELGQGEVNFPPIIDAVGNLGVEWVAYEQDRTQRTPEESIQMSRQFLRERFAW
jgi:sugar phosphate isomerase/epimerase